MSTNQSRIEVFVDIFDLTKQRAQTLPTITPSVFVAAILQEFAALEHLGNDPANYHLCKAAEHKPLDENTPLGEQLTQGDHLCLVENEAPLPKDTQRPSHRLYLRETSSGKVFHLQWVPAIIGRTATSLPNNDQVAVDLEAFPTALRVSRRHAVITEENGQFYVANLSDNSSALKDAEGGLRPITTEKVPLLPGQRIHLERSGIDLLVIVRNGAEGS